LDLGLAIAGQLAQLLDRVGWHEAGADQPVLDQLGDPGRRIGHIRLRPGTFRGCVAFSSQHSTWSSSSCQTGFQWQPVDSIRTRSPPKLASHSAGSTSPAVVVVNRRVSL